MNYCAAPRSSLLVARQGAPNSDRRTTESGERPARSERRTAESDPVTIAIDILDEAHSLRLAMRRLASDADLRTRLGASGQRYWQREHSLEAMLADYRRVLQIAAARPAPRVALPAHLVADGADRLHALTHELGLDAAALGDRGIPGLLE